MRTVRKMVSKKEKKRIRNFTFRHTHSKPFQSKRNEYVKKLQTREMQKETRKKRV